MRITLVRLFSLLILFLSIIPGTVWSLAIKASVTQGYAPLTVDFLAITHNSTGIPNFSWSTSDGQAYSSSDGRAQFTFYNIGTYRVTLTEPSQGSATVTIIIPEITAPIPSFIISDASIGTNTTESNSEATGEETNSTTTSVNSAPAPFITSLDASSSSSLHGNIIDYVWIASDGQTANGIKTSMVFTEPGSYKISLTVTDSNLARATTDQQIVVTEAVVTEVVVIANQLPQASFVASANIGESPLVIELDAKTSNDSDGFISQYQWTVDGKQTYYGVNTVISIIEVGVHNILLTVTDNEGLEAVSNQDFIVLDSPDNAGIDPSINRLPVAVFTATPSGDTDGNNIILPLTMLFDASNSEDLDGFITQYAWTVTPLPSVDFPQPLLGKQTSIAFPTQGIYTVNLTLTDNEGASATTNQQVSVIVAPVVEEAQALEQGEAQTRSRATLETFQLVDRSISRGAVDNSPQTLTSGIQVRDSQERYFIQAYAADGILDPRISLLSYPELKIIDSNDNWYLHQSANEIHSKGLSPNHSNDAAMLVTLTPGWYIVEVSPEKASGLGILDIKQIQLK